MWVLWDEAKGGEIVAFVDGGAAGWPAMVHDQGVPPVTPMRLGPTSPGGAFLFGGALELIMAGATHQDQVGGIVDAKVCTAAIPVSPGALLCVVELQSIPRLLETAIHTRALFTFVVQAGAALGGDTFGPHAGEKCLADLLRLRLLRYGGAL